MYKEPEKVIVLDHTSASTDVVLATDYLRFKEFDSNSLSPVFYFHSFTDKRMILGYKQSLNVVLKGEGMIDLVSRRFTGANHVLSGLNSLAYSCLIPANMPYAQNQKYPIESHRRFVAERIANTLRKMGLPDIGINDQASTITSEGGVIASHTLAYLKKKRKVLVHGLLTISPFDLSEIKNHFKFGSKTIRDGEEILLENLLTYAPSISDQISKTPEKIVRQFTTKFEELYSSREDSPIGLVIPNDDLISEFSNPGWRGNGRSTKISINSQTPGEENSLSNHDDTYCFFSQVSTEDLEKMAERVKKI